MSKASYTLPDTLVDWPWPRLLSPHYAEAKAESSAWVESFNPFEPKEQAEFNLCDLNLLACLTFSPGNKDYVRTGCDLMNFYFVYDEYTDVLDGAGAKQMADIVMDALHNPDVARPQGEPVVGEMVRQLWNRARKLAKPDAVCLSHFITGSADYVASVVQEAEDRANKRLRTVEDYLVIRRDTCAAKPTFSLVEFGLEIPEEVLFHPSIAKLTRGATELIAVINDLDSYVLELARGLDGHNVVTAVMYEHNLDVQGAMDWLESYTKNVVTQFLSDLKEVPSWGEETDKKVKAYIDGLGYWVRGNDTWSFETKRYYGEAGPEVQKTRVVLMEERYSKEGFVKNAEQILP